jgi:hypothetical protein
VRKHLETGYKNVGKFVYAMAKNWLSFMMANCVSDAYKSTEDSMDNEIEPLTEDMDRWPRTSQLIMLNEKADLLEHF